MKTRPDQIFTGVSEQLLVGRRQGVQDDKTDDVLVVDLVRGERVSGTARRREHQCRLTKHACMHEAKPDPINENKFE